MAHEHDQKQRPNVRLCASSNIGLRQMVDALRGTLEGAPEMIAVEDADTRYLAFNHAYHEEFKKVFGVDLKIGDSMSEALAHLPGERQAALALFDRTLRGEDFTVSREFGDERLERRFYEIHCFPIYDAEGRLIGGTHIARDVTDQRRAQEALRATETNYRRIIESSMDCIKVLDLDGTFLSINPAGQRLMEIEDLGAFLGSNWLDSWQGEDRLHAEEALDCARAGGVGRFRAHGATAKDNLKWWEETISPILDGDGQPERLLVIARDITDRKQTEDSLESERAFLRQVIDATPSLIFVKNWEGQFVLANAALARCYGTTVEGVIGKTDADFNPHPDELHHFRHDDQEVMRTRRELRILEEKVTYANGEVHWFSTFKVPLINEDGTCDKMLGVATDITQRKRAEDALRQSEERLKLAQHAGHVGVFDWDVVNDTAFISDEIESIFGLVPGAVQASRLNWAQYLLPDDLPRVRRDFNEYLSNKLKQIHIEYRILRGDGEIRWIEVNGQIDYLENGAPGRMIGTLADITERKEGENALRESEGKFRALAENARASFGIVQGQRFLYANPYFAQISGYSVEEILTMDFPQMVHPDYRDNMIEWARRRQRGENVPNHYEFAMVTKAGEMRWVEFSVGTIEYRGRPAIIGTGFDITERKRAEQDLKLRNERLALLSESAALLLKSEDPQTMILELFEKVSRHLDLQGYLNFVVNQTGDALRLESSAGMPPDITRQLQRLEFGQGVCGTVALHGQPIYAARILESESDMLKMLRDLGVRAYFCNPLMAGGRLLGTLAFATTTRDTYSEDDLEFMRTVSQYVAMAQERLRLTAELRRQNEQLGEADRRKDEFLAMLAHELRNPLAPIRNATQIMRLVGIADPALERQRDIIERQVTHMARLLGDLLDVSRITRGKIQCTMQPLALALVIEHAVETVVPMIEGRGQTLHLDQPPPSLRVLADLDRLGQAFSNLLTNASKYTREGGQIWLSASRVGNQAVVRVRDNGIGIEPEMLPRIFDLFTQADQGLAHAQGGLGIGLTLVRSLIQLHGGRVEARSEGAAKGSEFIIYLPALSEPSQAA